MTKEITTEQQYKRRMFRFLAVTALFNMSANFAHPVTPAIFKSLNLGSYMFGYAMAALMLFNFLFSPFWGKMNGYISSRVSLLINCVGYAIGQAMFALAKTEWQFLGGRMFAGVFTAGSFISLMTYVVNQAPTGKQRAYYLTLTATIQAVAGPFGFFLAGVLGAKNMMFPVWLQVATLTLCGVLFMFVCADDTLFPLRELQPKEIAREANPFLAFFESKHFMTVAIGFLFVVCCMQNVGAVIFENTFNFYITDQFGFDSSYNGIAKGVMGLVTLIANSTICIWIIRNANIKKAVIGVMALCAISILSSVIFDGVWGFVGFNIILFAFNGVSMPLLQESVARVSTDQNSNIVMGFYNAVKSLGGIVGAFLAGAMYTFNPKFPFYVGFVAFTIAVIFAYAYLKIGKSKQKAEDAT